MLFSLRRRSSDIPQRNCSRPIAVGGHVEFMDDWPARQSQDIGWAYVSITGAGFIEAVTVVVAEENGTAKIREIEWGRP